MTSATVKSGKRNGSNVNAQKIQQALNGIDWGAFTQRVMHKNAESAEAYERARAKSRELGTRHVML